MQKRVFLLFLIVSLFITWGYSAHASGMSQDVLYQYAQNELKRHFINEETMSLDELCDNWSSLGSYKKSASFYYYTSILRDIAHGDFVHILLYTSLIRLDAEFCLLLEAEGLPSIDALEAYGLGRQAESDGNLSGALKYYEQSTNVLDSMLRLGQLKASTAEVLATGIAADDYEIAIYSNGTCSISRYKGSAKSLAIPDRLLGYPVASIGERAFSFAACTSITLPSSVTSIGPSAFSYCLFLTSISIPESVQTIDDGAFFACNALSEVTLCEGVTSIGAEVFSACISLNSISIPDSVTWIGENAFSVRSSINARGETETTSATLHVSRNSCAYQYAIDNHIPYVLTETPSASGLMYIFPFSDTRKLTREEISEWDYESLGYAFNEIFARHGYHYVPSSGYYSYFSSKPWYTPNTNPDNQVAVYPFMTDIEWYNYNLIKQVRDTKKNNDSGRSLWDY